MMIAGGYLFVWAVRDISSEWPQIFVGLLSVFSTAMGFGLLIMPIDNTRADGKSGNTSKSP